MSLSNKSSVCETHAAFQPFPKKRKSDNLLLPEDHYIGENKLEMNSKSIEFNNAGVEMLAKGRIDDAHDLFRAALLCHIGNQPGEPTTTALAQVCGNTPEKSPDLAHTITYREEEVQEKSHPTYESGQTDIPTQIFVRDVSTFHPEAFAIENDLMQESSMTRHSAAIHVFNLGLVHQLKDAKSWKAKSFYELGALILAINTTTEVDELSLALQGAIAKNLQLCLCNARTISPETSITNAQEPTALQEKD